MCVGVADTPAVSRVDLKSMSESDNHPVDAVVAGGVAAGGEMAEAQTLVEHGAYELL
jgi:hypothetical protein